MDARIKGLWTAALRSGEFAQGKGSLRDADDKMCCLGVLCELAVREGAIPAPVLRRRGGNVGLYMYTDSVEELYLPSEVQQWAGLSDRNPVVGDTLPDGNDRLANRNDNGATFEKIADLIDRDL